MSRVQDILNRIELVAKKLEMSIEDAVAILEGKHPTHTVVVVSKEVTEAPAAPIVVETVPSAVVEPATAGSPSTETSTGTTQAEPVTATVELETVHHNED